MKNFYRLYRSIAPQLDEQFPITIAPQVVDKIAEDIFSTPWGHHKLLIDKYKKEPKKAFFFVRKTIENGWSVETLTNCRKFFSVYSKSYPMVTNYQI